MLAVKSQTTNKSAKYPKKHPLISQKLHRFFFPEDIFYELKYFLCPSYARREMGAFFDLPARFRISPSPMYSSLPSLIVDYNRIHKLLTQLRTLTKCLRRLGLTMVRLPLKSPDVSTLKVLAFLRVFDSGLFKISHHP